MKTKNRNGDLPSTRKQLLAELDRVVKKAAALSPREHFANMVRLGIYTKAGRLTKQYGGYGDGRFGEGADQLGAQSGTAGEPSAALEGAPRRVDLVEKPSRR